MKESKAPLGFLAVIALVVFSFFIPGLRWILIGGAILVAVIVVIIIIAIVASNKDEEKNRTSSRQGTALTEEEAEVINRGRRSLLELRKLQTRIRDRGIRSASEEVCKVVDRILLTLKEKSDQIPDVRQFLNYYLPTISEVLNKFIRLESSGQAGEETQKKVSSFLSEAHRAMERQYDNLFEDDKLNLEVEMEAMQIALKRDGLSDNVSSGKDRINLTL